MKIGLTRAFQRDFKKLNAKARTRIYHVLERLPPLLGRAHLHSGVGIRKLHPSGIFEARIGLGLRLIFSLRKNKLTCHRIGDHNIVSRYLKNL